MLSSAKILSMTVMLTVFFGPEGHAEPSPVGTWDVVGRDDSGTEWKAILFLEPRDKDEYPPTRLKGHFDWDGSNKTGGREYVVLASYDYETRQLQLQGAELEDADPNICSTIYKASMSEGADRLEDGTWKSCGVIPGEWSAARSLERMPSRKRPGLRGGSRTKANQCVDGTCPLVE